MASKTSLMSDRPQVISMQNVPEAVPGNGAYTAFPTSIGTNERIGIEILAVEYQTLLDDILSLDAGDSHFFGLTQIKNNIPIAGGNPWPAGTIDFQEIGCAVIAAGPTEPLYHVSPRKIEFPEPVLVHPASLYAWNRSKGALSLTIQYVRITYRYVTLNDKDYQDILQTIIAQNII